MVVDGSWFATWGGFRVRVLHVKVRMTRMIGTRVNTLLFDSSEYDNIVRSAIHVVD